MKLNARISKLDGGAGPACICGKRIIHPDMDPIEASQIYHQMIRCKAHLPAGAAGERIRMSPEEAERLYLEMMGRTRL